MNPASRIGFTAAVALLTCGATGALKDDKVYTTHYKFSVTAPDGWHRDPVKQGVIVSYSSPSSDAGTVANLNVVVRALPGSDTLGTVFRRTDAQLAKTSPGTKKLKTSPGTKKLNASPGTLDGRPAITSVYTTPGPGYTLVSFQTVAVIGTTIYALTGTTDQVNARAFGPVHTAFVKSFRVSK